MQVPLEVLKRYSNITYPQDGEIWRGNFYKCAYKTLNLHYLTWAVVNNDTPDFHLPDYFEF